MTSKDITFRLIQQLEEDKKKGAGGMILATLWEEDLAYLLQMASRHGGIARASASEHHSSQEDSLRGRLDGIEIPHLMNDRHNSEDMVIILKIQFNREKK